MASRCRVSGRGRDVKWFSITFLFLSFCIISSGCGMRTNKPEQIHTEETKYRSYVIGLKERIEGVWKYPSEAAKGGIHGVALIKFTIRKNGQLTDIQLVETSGYNDLDEAVIQALKDAEPYPPLPDDWGKDQLPITGRFVYSISNKSPYTLGVPRDPFQRSSESSTEMFSAPR